MNWLKRIRKSKTQPAPSFPVLQTERLVLRMFDLNDTVDVFAYAQSPEVGPMAGWAPHKTMEDSRRVVQLFIDRGEVWAIVEKRSGRVIGSIGLHADAKRDAPGVRMLGYVLGEPYWGQGYATEAALAVLRFAFEELACPIVSVYHFPKNARSKRVIKKLGFAPEGVLRMATSLPDGTVLDDVCYSMTREEFLAQQAKPVKG
ncbi:MAG: GNAT family protein [Candidatus Limiplasma sp.]|nr:GNAT family protein [Candidatus Limiplasma sp.]MEA5146561.1 GNAT family protein [Candidatus Limiplasma sp.]